MSRRDTRNAIRNRDIIRDALRRLEPYDTTTKGDERSIETVLTALATLTDSTLNQLDRKARYTVTPDGYRTTSSGTGTPPLIHPTTQAGLRTNPSDPLRRKREHGYNDTTPVETPTQQRSEQPHSDPVGHAIRTIFDTLADMATLTAHLTAHLGHSDEWACTIRPTLKQLAAKARTITRAADFIEHVRTKAAGRQTSLAGPCTCCGRIVYGTAADPRIGTKEDRLRSGYCNACRIAWTTAGRPDRPFWERQRREKLSSQQDLQSQTTAM